MRHLPAILALTLLLASCATLHKETTSNSTSSADTTHITSRRDSIIIKEQIITHYDPSTGMMMEQVIDKLTSQVTDLSEYRETILHQQQLIDSLITANLALASSHQNDSTYTSDIKEKGDAARTGWQSLLKAGTTTFIVGLLLLLVVLLLQHYIKPRK